MFSTRRFQDFFHWRIFASVRVDLDGVFTPENVILLKEYTPLCELTKLVLSTLQKSFIRGIYTSVQISFIFLNEDFLPLCNLIKMVLSALENVSYLKNIHLCASVFLFYFIEEYLPLSKQTKIVFSTIKMSSTWRIYTSVWGIFTSMRVNKNGISTLKYVLCISIFSWNEIYLCASWQKWCFLYLKMVVYMKNKRFCLSVFQFFH